MFLIISVIYLNTFLVLVLVLAFFLRVHDNRVFKLKQILGKLTISSFLPLKIQNPKFNDNPNIKYFAVIRCEYFDAIFNTLHITEIFMK